MHELAQIQDRLRVMEARQRRLRAFLLLTDQDGPRISLSQPTEDEEDDAPPELELRAADHAGSIELRRDGRSIFRAPQ